MATFKPGETVERSGIYRVYHNSHRLMHEATLLAGDLFPICRQCGDQVRFEGLRPLRDRDVLPFREGVILTLHPKARKMAV